MKGLPLLLLAPGAPSTFEPPLREDFQPLALVSPRSSLTPPAHLISLLFLLVLPSSHRFPLSPLPAIALCRHNHQLTHFIHTTALPSRFLSPAPPLHSVFRLTHPQLASCTPPSPFPDHFHFPNGEGEWSGTEPRSGGEGTAGCTPLGERVLAFEPPSPTHQPGSSSSDEPIANGCASARRRRQAARLRLGLAPSARPAGDCDGGAPASGTCVRLGPDAGNSPQSLEPAVVRCDRRAAVRPATPRVQLRIRTRLEPSRH